MSISALLTNFNNNDTILKSIRHLIEQEYPLENILVVDNGSTDGSPQQIRETFPHVEVIELGTNHGLTVARNIGLKRLKSDLVLLLDSDIYVSNDALKWMVAALNDTASAVICPRIILYPQVNTIQFDGAAIHFAGTLSLTHSRQPVSEHPPILKHASGFGGGCLLLDRNIIASLGYFDEDYFFYFEDLELSYRVKATGYKIYCEERAVVVHDMGEGIENLSYRGIGSYPAQRAFLTLRNRWLSMLIHYQARSLLLLAPALFIYEFASLIEVLRRGWLREYLRALYSLLQSANSILIKRKRQQSRRTVKDKEILTGGDLPFAQGFVTQKMETPVQILNLLLNTYWNWIKQWL